MKVIFCLFIVNFIVFPILAQKWSNPVVIMDSGSYPCLAFDNNNKLNLVFNGAGPVDTDIFYSFLNGKKWSPPINLSNSKNKSIEPKITIDNQGVIYVIWQEKYNMSSTLYRKPRLHYCFYKDKKWSHINFYNQSNSIQGNLTVSRPVIDKTQQCHLMWGYQPFMKYIHFKNGILSKVINLSRRGSYPDIYMDKQNILHVAYIDVAKKQSYGRNDVFYSFYSLNKNSWSDSIVVYNNPDQYSFSPQIIQNDKRCIHIVWLEDENLDFLPDAIYHSYSYDGVYWYSAHRISNGDGNCYAFSMCMDSNGYLHIVWDQSTALPKISVDHIFYSYFNGKSWSKPQRVTPKGKRMGGLPTMVADNQDKLHLVYVGKLNENDKWKLLYSTCRLDFK